MIREEGAVLRQRLHSPDNLIIGFRLQQVAAGPRVKYVADLVLSGTQRKDQDLGPRRSLADFSSGRDPAHDRKRDIENSNVRLMAERKLHRLATIARFRAYFKDLSRFENHTQATPHDRLVDGK